MKENPLEQARHATDRTVHEAILADFEARHTARIPVTDACPVTADGPTLAAQQHLVELLERHGITTA